MVVVERLAAPARDGGFGADVETDGAVAGDEDLRRRRLAWLRRTHRCAVGGAEPERTVIETPDLEPPFVHEPMVSGTQQHEVVERGLASVRPVAYVMPVKAMGGRAAGKAAATVAIVQRPANRWRNSTRAPSYRERLPSGAVDSRDDAPVAAKTTRGLRRDGAVVLDFAPPRVPVREHFRVHVNDDFMELRGKGRSAGGFEHPLGHPRERIRAAHRA